MDESVVLTKLEGCICELRKWMSSNKLKLNDSKTEFLVLGSVASLKMVSTSSIHIGDHDIELSTCVRNIGAFFDNTSKMEKHVKSICKSAWFNLYRISKVRDYLSEEQTKTVIHAFVTSKLDSFNSLLGGLPATVISKLQRIQNSSAKLIMGGKKHDHVTPILRHLHWLPVQQ